MVAGINTKVFASESFTRYYNVTSASFMMSLEMQIVFAKSDINSVLVTREAF